MSSTYPVKLKRREKCPFCGHRLDAQPEQPVPIVLTDEQMGRLAEIVTEVRIDSVHSFANDYPPRRRYSHVKDIMEVIGAVEQEDSAT